MHPILFSIGSFTIHTYGMMAALGFLAGVGIIIWLSPKEGLPIERMIDLAFWTLIIGFLGCRVVYVFTRWDQFANDLGSIFKVWEGGLVWYGGPLFGIPFGFWFMRRAGISPWKAADVAMPAMAIGHMFGRFGCLAAGCCYGKPTDLPWGVGLNSDLVDRSLRDIPLHPTQLYEAFALLLLVVGLCMVRARKKFDGQVFLVYLISYPIIRSIVEVYRGDTIRGFVIDGVLSTSQFISILVFIGGIILLGVRLKQVKE